MMTLRSTILQVRLHCPSYFPDDKGVGRPSDKNSHSNHQTFSAWCVWTVGHQTLQVLNPIVDHVNVDSQGNTTSGFTPTQCVETTANCIFMYLVVLVLWLQNCLGSETLFVGTWPLISCLLHEKLEITATGCYAS